MVVMNGLSEFCRLRPSGWSHPSMLLSLNAQNIPRMMRGKIILLSGLMLRTIEESARQILDIGSHEPTKV
jgi:hypothetical protein